MSHYFWPILTPSPLSHFTTHPKTLPSTSHISDPPFLVCLVHKIWTKPPVQISLNCLRGLLSGGFCQGVFCLEDFVQGGFCRYPFCQNTSITTESQKSL